MRPSPRPGFRLVFRLALILIAVAILVVRLIPRHHPATPPTLPPRSVPDLSRTHPLNQPGGGPVPTEAYEVYSALYQTPAQTQTDEPLVFAAQSRTDIPQVGGSCIKPSTPAEDEMTDDFIAANQQSHLWETKFTIAQNYSVLSPADTAQVQACLQAHDTTSARCAASKNTLHIRFLGVPGYDHTHTHALVSVIKNCGGFCGSGGIFAVEKHGATWQRSDTTDFTRDCSWAY